MSIAFLGTMANFIYILRKDHTYQTKKLMPNKKNDARNYHMTAMSITYLLIFAGFLAIYINKIINKGYGYLTGHFATWHGKFGLVTFISVTIQALIGLPFWPLFTKSILGKLILPENGFIKNNLLKGNLMLHRKIHAIFGAILFIFSAGALFTAFRTNWFENNVNLKIYSNMHVIFMAIVGYSYGLILLQVYNRYLVKNVRTRNDDYHRR